MQSSHLVGILKRAWNEYTPLHSTPLLGTRVFNQSFYVKIYMYIKRHMMIVTELFVVYLLGLSFKLSLIIMYNLFVIK